MDLGQRPILFGFQVHLALDGIARGQDLPVSGVDNEHDDLDPLLEVAYLAHDHFRDMELAVSRDLQEKKRPPDPQFIESRERSLHRPQQVVSHHLGVDLHHWTARMRYRTRVWTGAVSELPEYVPV